MSSTVLDTTQAYSKDQMIAFRRLFDLIQYTPLPDPSNPIPDAVPVNELEREFKVTRVHWRDANHASGWHSREELEALVNTPLPEMETIGWLVHSGPDFVVLAQSVGEFSAADIIKIPTAQVIDIYTIGDK